MATTQLLATSRLAVMAADAAVSLKALDGMINLSAPADSSTAYVLERTPVGTAGCALRLEKSVAPGPKLWRPLVTAPLPPSQHPQPQSAAEAHLKELIQRSVQQGAPVQAKPVEYDRRAAEENIWGIINNHRTEGMRGNQRVVMCTPQIIEQRIAQVDEEMVRANHTFIMSSDGETKFLYEDLLRLFQRIGLIEESMSQEAQARIILNYAIPRGYGIYGPLAPHNALRESVRSTLIVKPGQQRSLQASPALPVPELAPRQRTASHTEGSPERLMSENDFAEAAAPGGFWGRLGALFRRG